MEDWYEVDQIDTYIACVFGPDGDQPGEVRVILQQHDGELYRWAECDDAGTHNVGDPTTKGEAIRQGEELARLIDETPDIDECVQRVVASGYFGSAAADDIREICEHAADHSCGCILLPRGYVPRPMIWTTDGYLQCDHIVLEAADSVALAAHSLAMAVESK